MGSNFEDSEPGLHFDNSHEDNQSDLDDFSSNDEGKSPNTVPDTDEYDQ